MKYSPFLSQFLKPRSEGNTLTFLERRKTRERHPIGSGLWIRETAVEERESNVFSSLTTQLTALACVTKDRLTGGKHTNLLNISFMWSESPWKQNKETGKPLPISAKFKEEGDNHAGVLGKEAGRTCGNRLEDIGRPACSGCLLFVLFFCPWFSSQTDLLSSGYTIYETRAVWTISGSRRMLLGPASGQKGRRTRSSFSQMSGSVCWSYMPWAPHQ